MQIRHVRLSDAGALIGLFSNLADETDFMQFELSDTSSSLDEQESELRSFIASTLNADAPEELSNGVFQAKVTVPPTQVMFVIEQQGELIGFIVGVAGYVCSNPHSLGLVMGIRQAQQGLGLGKQLLAALGSWAELQGYAALELTVMAHNSRAVQLYQSAGFTLQGTRENAFELNGKPVDELYMQKALTP